MHGLDRGDDLDVGLGCARAAEAQAQNEESDAKPPRDERLLNPCPVSCVADRGAWSGLRSRVWLAVMPDTWSVSRGYA